MRQISLLAAGLGLLGVGSAAAQDVPFMAIDNSGPATVKLVILLGVFVVVLIAARRVRVGAMVRAAAVWGLAFAVLAALYTYRDQLETAGREMVAAVIPGAAVTSGDQVIVRRAFQGHFVLNGEVGGAPVSFLFDTGASTVVLTAEDAARAGYDLAALDYRVPVMTAAGMTDVAPVRIDELTIGDIRMEGVRAAIARVGDLDHSLLGMTFLNRLEGYEVRRDRLVLNP